MLSAQKDSTLTWKHYTRGGIANTDSTIGGFAYYRINRQTDNTFRDLRVFSYSLKNDSFIYSPVSSCLRLLSVISKLIPIYTYAIRLVISILLIHFFIVIPQLLIEKILERMLIFNIILIKALGILLITIRMV